MGGIAPWLLGDRHPCIQRFTETAVSPAPLSRVDVDVGRCSRCGI